MESYLIETNDKKYIKGFVKFIPTDNFDDTDEMIIKCKQSYSTFRTIDDDWGKKGDLIESDVLGQVSMGAKSSKDFHQRCPDFNKYYDRVHLYVYTEERINDDDYCVNINTDKIYKITHSLFSDWFELGWRKIVATTDPKLEITYTLYEDEMNDLEVYRYRKFPTLEYHNIVNFVNLSNNHGKMECWVQMDTSDHNDWYQNTDEELIDDYQKRMGIYEQVRNHDQGFLESDLIEMYDTYFKEGIYVDSDDNTIKILKDDLTPVSDPVVKTYTQDELERLIRYALESKGFTPESEVREFFKKHGIADYPIW